MKTLNIIIILVLTLGTHLSKAESKLLESGSKRHKQVIQVLREYFEKNEISLFDYRARVIVQDDGVKKSIRGIQSHYFTAWVVDRVNDKPHGYSLVEDQGRLRNSLYVFAELDGIEVGVENIPDFILHEQSPEFQKRVADTISQNNKMWAQFTREILEQGTPLYLRGE